MSDITYGTRNLHSVDTGELAYRYVYSDLADDVRAHVERTKEAAEAMSNAAARAVAGNRSVRPEDVDDLHTGVRAAWRLYEQACSAAMQALMTRSSRPVTTVTVGVACASDELMDPRMKAWVAANKGVGSNG